MKISAIIPFYYGNDYIGNLLEMFEINVSNVEVDLELIFVNDSPSVEIQIPEREYSFTIRIITNERNQGIQRTRIVGIEEAKGDYIVMLDQDDLIAGNWLDSQMNTIGDADFCIANGYETQTLGNKKALYKNYSEQLNCLRLNCYYYYRNPIISPGQVLIKKDAIPKGWLTNPFKENGADDALLWMLMLLEKKQGVLNEDKLYIHVYTGNNTSLNTDKMMRSTFELTDALSGKISSFKRLCIKRRARYYGCFSRGFLHKLKFLDVALIRRFYSILYRG